jgi:hypothetical protein
MKTPIFWSLVDDDLLRKLAKSGASLPVIAVQMQRNKSTVRSRALKLGIAIAKDGNLAQKLSRITSGDTNRTKILR